MNHHIRRGIALLVALAAVCIGGVRAQDAPAARPKIGLVLGGGGARGFAHIGVLEWLEQNRIPIDYIGGTSMGGLVGGMYSIGMTPQEMRGLVERIDWPQVLSGNAPYSALTVRGKADRRELPGALEFGLRGGFRTPGGLNAGQGIGLIFSRVALPYTESLDFDTLPIPLRVVATDIVKGEQLVIGSGPLDRAMRSTMAVPGLFSPVEWDGRLLVDGTLVNNVPTDVVKAMGADIVIVVDVGTPLQDEKALNSIFGILRQSLSIISLQTVQKNIAPAPDRIIVRPDLGTFTFADFPAALAIADRGYDQVKGRSELVSRLSLDPAAWDTYQAARRAYARRTTITPQFLQVTGVEGPAREAIRRDLQRFVGQPLTEARIAELEERLTAFTGSGRFERLSYDSVEADGRTGLQVRVAPKLYGPPFLLAGLSIDGSETDRIELNLRARLLQFDIARFGTEWRTDAGIGTLQILGTELFVPLTGRPLSERAWFLAPRAGFERSTEDIYRGGDRVAEYRVRQASVGIDVGRTLSHRSEVRLGYGLGHIGSEIRVGDPLLPTLSGRVSVASLRYRYDGQDSPTVPTRGLMVRTRGAWYFDSPGADDAFPLAEGSASLFAPAGGSGTAFTTVDGGTTFYATAPPAQEFTLGGPLRLGAYGRDEFRGSHYVFARAGYLHRLQRLSPLLGSGVWAGGWLEVGDVFDRLESVRYRSSLSAGILADTRLGPLFVGGSLGERGRRSFYFSVGRLF